MEPTSVMALETDRLAVSPFESEGRRMRSRAVEVLLTTEEGEGYSCVGVVRSRARSRVVKAVLVVGLVKLDPNMLERLASTRLKVRKLGSGSASTLPSR